VVVFELFYNGGTILIIEGPNFAGWLFPMKMNPPHRIFNGISILDNGK
jgi:hypothetical protein